MHLSTTTDSAHLLAGVSDADLGMEERFEELPASPDARLLLGMLINISQIANLNSQPGASYSLPPPYNSVRPQVPDDFLPSPDAQLLFRVPANISQIEIPDSQPGNSHFLPPPYSSVEPHVPDDLFSSPEAQLLFVVPANISQIETPDSQPGTSQALPPPYNSVGLLVPDNIFFVKNDDVRFSPEDWRHLKFCRSEPKDLRKLPSHNFEGRWPFSKFDHAKDFLLMHKLVFEPLADQMIVSEGAEKAYKHYLKSTRSSDDLTKLMNGASRAYKDLHKSDNDVKLAHIRLRYVEALRFEEQGHFGEAEKLYTECLKFQTSGVYYPIPSGKSLWARDWWEILWAQNKVAIVNLSLGNTEEARKHNKDAWETFLNKVATNQNFFTQKMTFAWLGFTDALISMDSDPREALRCLYERCLPKLEVWSTSSWQHDASWYQLALVYFWIGNIILLEYERDRHYEDMLGDSRSRFSKVVELAEAHRLALSHPMAIAVKYKLARIAILKDYRYGARAPLFEAHETLKAHPELLNHKARMLWLYDLYLSYISKPPRSEGQRIVIEKIEKEAEDIEKNYSLDYYHKYRKCRTDLSIDERRECAESLIPILLR
ncbi:hypothetical protein MMC13_006386 [Lambiella insularis]|nr:hypothetical protein [Lambiella insularis]